MENITSVKLAGVTFNIEQNACVMLNEYLAGIKSAFENDPSGVEIIIDFELRMAELFNAFLEEEGTEVLNQAIVMHVIEQLGKPEDFNNNNTNHASTPHNIPHKKKLFRNPTDKILAGVCSGFAAYFGIENWIVRTLWILSVIVGGWGVFLYIIFWMIVPKAKSEADLQAMQGKPFTIDDLIKKISRQNPSSNKNILNMANGIFESLVYGIIKFALKVTGILLIIAAIAIVIVLLALYNNELNFTFNNSLTVSNYSFDLFKILDYLHGNATENQLLKYSLLFSLLIPVVALLAAGVILWSRKLNFPAYFWLVLSTVWVFNVAIVGYVFFKITLQFSRHYTLQKQIPLANMPSQHYILSLLPATDTALLSSVSFHHHQQYYRCLMHKDKLSLSNVMLILKPTHKELPYLLYEASAFGTTLDEAKQNAETIAYSFKVEDNSLFISDIFTLSNGMLWRNQQVTVSIYVPHFHSVSISPLFSQMNIEVENLINDIPTEYLPGKTLQSTPDGFECKDC